MNKKKEGKIVTLQKSLTPDLQLSRDHEENWISLTEKDPLYHKIKTEIFRRCPLLQQKVYSDKNQTNNKVFTLHIYSLKCYSYYDIVNFTYQEKSYYGLIPGIELDNDKISTSGLSKEGCYIKKRDIIYETVGNFYPLYRTEQLKRFNSIMGFKIHKNTRILEKKLRRKNISDENIAKEIEKIFNSKNNKSSLIEYILLDFALRGLLLTKNSFSSLFENDCIECESHPIKNSFLLNINDLIVRKRGINQQSKMSYQKINIQISPKTGEIFFLYKGEKKNINEDTPSVNSIKFKILHRTRTATPIIHNWQPCTPNSSSRLRFELEKKYNTPPQHINLAIFRQAKLICYDNVHLIEILVPELGMFRQSYLLWSNLCEEENASGVNTPITIHPLDTQEDSFLNFNKKFPPSIKIDINDKNKENSIKNDALLLYLKFYAWAIHSYHIVHHPFSLGFTAHESASRLCYLNDTHKVIHNSIHDSPENENTITYNFLCFKKLLLIKKSASIDLNTVGFPVTFKDINYSYNYNSFKITNIYFGNEPLGILRNEHKNFYQHYLITQRQYKNTTSLKVKYDFNDSIENFILNKTKYNTPHEHYDISNLRFNERIDLKTLSDTSLEYWGSKHIKFSHCEFSKLFSITEFNELPQMIFYRCTFFEGFSAINARLKSNLIFIECRFDPIEVEHNTINHSSKTSTAINLFHAHIDGDIIFQRCIIAGRIQAIGLKLQRSFRLRGSLVREHINKNLFDDTENTQDNKNTYNQLCLRFRNLTNTAQLYQKEPIIRSILKNFSIRKSYEVTHTSTFIDFFNIYKISSFGLEDEKVKLDDYSRDLPDFLKKNTIINIINAFINRDDVWLHSNMVDFLHHLLLDPVIGAAIFGRTRVKDYRIRFHETLILIAAEQDSSDQWRKEPALSLEYADINGDLEFVAGAHEPYYSTNIEECFQNIGADTGRAWVTHITSHLMLRNIRVRGNVSLTGLICHGNIDLTLADIDGDVIGFSETAYAQYIRTPHLVAMGNIIINDAKLRGYLKFYRAYIKGSLSLYSTTINGNVDLHGLHVGRNLDLTYCTITGYLYAVENIHIARLLPTEKSHGNLVVHGDMTLSGANISKVECRGIHVEGGIYIINGNFGQLIFSVGIEWERSEDDFEYFLIKPHTSEASHIIIRTITVEENIDLTGIRVTAKPSPNFSHVNQREQTLSGLELSNSTINGDLEFSSETYTKDLRSIFKRSAIPIYLTVPNTESKDIQHRYIEDDAAKVLASYGTEPKQIHIKADIQGDLKLYGNKVDGHIDLRNTYVHGEIFLQDTEIKRRLNLGSIYPVDIDYRAGLTTYCHRLEMDRLVCTGEVNLSGLIIATSNKRKHQDYNDETPISLSATNVNITNAISFILPPRHAREEFIIGKRFPHAEIQYGVNFTGSTIFRLTIADENFNYVKTQNTAHIDIDRCSIDHLMLVIHKENPKYPILSVAEANIHSWDLKEITLRRMTNTKLATKYSIGMKKNTLIEHEINKDKYSAIDDPAPHYIKLLKNTMSTDRKVWLALELQLRQAGRIKDADEIHHSMSKSKLRSLKGKNTLSTTVSDSIANSLFKYFRTPFIPIICLLLSSFLLTFPQNITLSLSATQTYIESDSISFNKILTYSTLCSSKSLKLNNNMCHEWNPINGIILSLQYIIPLIDNEFESTWQARASYISSSNSLDKHEKNVHANICQPLSLNHRAIENSCYSVISWIPITPHQVAILCALLFWVTVLSYSFYSYQALRYGRS